MNYTKIINSIKTLASKNNTAELFVRRRGNYTLYNTVKAEEEALEKIQNKKNIRSEYETNIKKLSRSIPLSLKYLNNDICQDETIALPDPIPAEEIQSNFPFQSVVTLEKNISEPDSSKDMYELMRSRNELIKEKKNWMVNYDNFDDSLQNDSEEMSTEINYGTPDPNSKISHIPCGGCGAYLHCKDVSLPGYIPSEIFKNSKQHGAADLTALICQRCYFLKNHNIALEVQVSDDDYPEVLRTISTKKSVVILMVDLTDFPCSIWPGIADIFHKMPILVVGNKVDLLPKDSPKYLDNVKKKLKEQVLAWGFARSSLIDVILLSATTGYGVEELIITLQRSWKLKGDVYLVGCTNVGKSSLFNTLLKSDYCKSQADDLIQRATTSVWPGTTLNLLKFPVSKPGGYKLKLRLERLEQLKKLERFEAKEKERLLRETNDWRHAVLMGRIDRSSSKSDEFRPKDIFSISPSLNATGVTKLGLQEDDPLYVNGRWCYDTPGVVHNAQILNLLTTEELFLTLPKTLIKPRTYCIRCGDSLFIAGLARLDYVEGERSIWFTVFASEELPISLCLTKNAEEFYRKFLGTKYLRVPCGDSARLKKWPGLSEAKTFKVSGIDYDYSSKDVVLSNAGWISVTGRRGTNVQLRAWTPDKRGCFVRDCLLPQAVNLKGVRIRSTPAYKKYIYYAEDDLWY